jgi:hypothetical protein
MPTANEYRQYAQDCLLLATTAIDFYAQDALISWRPISRKWRKACSKTQSIRRITTYRIEDSHSWRSRAVGRK